LLSSTASPRSSACDWRFIFAPLRGGRRDIHLFEVLDGFGGDVVEPEGKFFEFGYGSTPGIPLPSGISLRMVLTNPIELEEAIRRDWKGVEQLRAAREAGRAIVIYADAKGKRLWDSIE
jgi:hypothetical protein